MGEFQLILLDEARNRARAGMASFIVPPQSPAADPQDEPEWLLPGDALARVQAVLGDRTLSIDTIVRRLKAGLFKATYETAKWEKITSPPKLNPDFIEPKYWDHYERAINSAYVWQSSDLRLFIGSSIGHMMDTSVALTFFKVKIERAGIEEIIANSVGQPQRRRWVSKPPPVEAPKVEAPEPEQKGPPVSSDHLKAWFDLYQRVYSGPTDTEANALASARGMFQGKSVSRDKVRALRGSQKRGRKADETAK